VRLINIAPDEKLVGVEPVAEYQADEPTDDEDET